MENRVRSENRSSSAIEGVKYASEAAAAAAGNTNRRALRDIKKIIGAPHQHRHLAASLGTGRSPGNSQLQWRHSLLMPNWCFLITGAHGHFVEDVVLSFDVQFALSASWDGELRLWDLSTGLAPCCFSPNRYWLCAATEDSVKIWT